MKLPALCVMYWSLKDSEGKKRQARRSLHCCRWEVERAAKKWEILTRASSSAETDWIGQKRAWSNEKSAHESKWLFAQEFMRRGASEAVRKEKLRGGKRMLEITLIIPIQLAERKMKLIWGLSRCCQYFSVIFNERGIFFIYCLQPDAGVMHTSMFVVSDSVQKSKAKLFTVCFLLWKRECITIKETFTYKTISKLFFFYICNFSPSN